MEEIIHILIYIHAVCGGPALQAETISMIAKQQIQLEFKIILRRF